MAGAIKRMERERRQAISAAHLTATLTRVNAKKFPRLDVLLKKTEGKNKVAQTWQQQFQIAMLWHHKLGGARLRTGKE